jgi:hypothetical protein
MPASKRPFGREDRKMATSIQNLIKDLGDQAFSDSRVQEIWNTCLSATETPGCGYAKGAPGKRVIEAIHSGVRRAMPAKEWLRFFIVKERDCHWIGAWLAGIDARDSLEAVQIFNEFQDFYTKR